MSKYKLGDYTIKNWNDWDRVPRDPVTIGAMIVTGTGYTAAAATVLAAAGTLAYVGYAVVGYVATTLVTAALTAALTPKPKLGSSSGSGGLLTNARGAINSAEVVYGEIRKGGTVTFLESTGSNNKILHQVIVLAAHEVEEIGDIYLNDEVVSMSGENVTSAPYKNFVKIYKHRGNQTSATTPFANSSSTLANTLHSDTSATSSFIGKNLAYLYCRFVYDQDAFVNGLPTVTAVIKGKKIKSTVNGVEQTPSYSSNATWVIRDFLTSSYGLDDDQIDYATFEAAADICDDTTVLSDGSAQYQINGVVSLGDTKGDVLQDLVAACGGSLFWGSGYWKLYAGEFVAPTKTLTLDDLRGPINLTTKAPMRDNFNRVSGTFIDKSADWISGDYPAIESTTFLTEDSNVETTLDLPLPYTTNGLAAQRLAKQMLYRGREQISFSADFGLEALDIEVGDFIKFRNERYGWGVGDEKVFEVIGWRLNPDPDNYDLRINLNLRESSEAAFGFTVADEQTIVSNNSTLLKYYEVPPIGVTVSQEYRQINENVVNLLNVQVQSSEIERLDSVIVKYKKTSDSSFKSVGQTILVNEGNDVGRFEIVGIDTPQIGEPSINYTVHVTPVNSFGFRGTPVVTYYNVQADSVPPNAPASLSKVLAGSTAFFVWEPSTSLDLSHYKLYYNSDVSANFGDSGNEIKITKIARPATSISFPASVGKYFVSAVDKTGNESQVNVPSVLIGTEELPALAGDQFSDEHTSFSGNKSNLTVSNGQLYMTTFGTSGSSGTYDFYHGGNSYFDLGQARTARCSYSSTHTRKHANAINGQVNWDDIPFNWDSWPNFWDTWTDEDAAFQDHSVIVEARSGSTVANMASASWTAVPCELVGRYVEFRARLTNSGPNVSPAVTELTATVEY